MTSIQNQKEIPGWHKLMTLVNNPCAVNGRCFYIEREAKTFVNSKENCKAKGGKIYEPKNVYELNGIAMQNWGFRDLYGLE